MDNTPAVPASLPVNNQRISLAGANSISTFFEPRAAEFRRSVSDDDDDVEEGDNDIGDTPYVSSNREVMLKELTSLQVGHDKSNSTVDQNDYNQQRRVPVYQNKVTIAGPCESLYHQGYTDGPEGSGSRQKELLIDNACGFSGRKDNTYPRESGESLKAILSDPITGALMDDAVILPCGHSFGSGGIQHVLMKKACFTCSQPVSEEEVLPNRSLRALILAFRREEELQVPHSTKRRRERFEQEKGSYIDPMPMDHPRSSAFQFPFTVTDRVIIKGNKRTPARFVGREAIVTTQCLNGWYVVKTLDSAESVKLQYRSLAKVPDHTPSVQPSDRMPANWH